MQRDLICLTNLDQSLFEISQDITLTNGVIREVIQKKTKRGRKSKTELPKEQKCDLCLEYFQFTSSEERSKCNTCKAEFHSSCYKTPVFQDEDFTCERCIKAKEEQKGLECYK